MSIKPSAGLHQFALARYKKEIPTERKGRLSINGAGVAASVLVVSQSVSLSLSEGRARRRVMGLGREH